MNNFLKNNVSTILTFLVLAAGVVTFNANLNSRVLAIETRNEKADILNEEIPVMNERQLQMAKDLEDIKTDLKIIAAAQSDILVKIEQVKQQTR